MVEKRSLIFLKNTIDQKRRPYICIAVFKNNAGVHYNYLVVPLTTKTTIGLSNLVLVKHHKLKQESYAKLCNIVTISADDIEEIHGKLNIRYFRKITSKLKSIIYE